MLRELVVGGSNTFMASILEAIKEYMNIDSTLSGDS